MSNRITVEFTEKASADLEKIKILGDCADIGEALSRAIGTQVTLMEYIAKGYAVQLHKRGKPVRTLDLSNEP